MQTGKVGERATKLGPTTTIIMSLSSITLHDITLLSTSARLAKDQVQFSVEQLVLSLTSCYPPFGVDR